ncbi:hypothetical protein [Paracoccus sp. (in: a-proteobacteria)]|uniref:hypothetical protein n=1 Tax=Paracoccus sp. TaxID=267 RepID=UPI004058B7B0
MTQATIKRGATFEARAVFTADEWANIYPWTAITATVKQGDATHVLTASVDAANRTVTFTGDTSDWEMVRGLFDVKITRGTEVIYLPGTRNIAITVIEGVS